MISLRVIYFSAIVAKILVVDDAPAQLLAYKAALARKGYQVTTAEGYHEGHAALRAGKFDLVVSDFCLNGQNGQGLLLSQEAKAAKVAVVMLATRKDFRKAVKTLRDNVDRCLYKPVAAKALLAAVNQMTSD